MLTVAGVTEWQTTAVETILKTTRKRLFRSSSTSPRTHLARRPQKLETLGSRVRGNISVMGEWIALKILNE
jgi:hypothetical protein